MIIPICPLEEIKAVKVLVTIRLGDGAEGAEDERERRRTTCVPGVHPLH
jgi:hypothetical protein